MSDSFGPFSEARCGRAPAALRFEVKSEPQEIDSRKNPAARPREIDLAVVLSRVIESFEHDPAQLRSTVYEIARIKFEKEICQIHPANSLEASRLTLALESAIEGVETLYSNQDKLRALRSLHRLIESSGFGRSEVAKPREPLLIMEQRPPQTVAHAANRISNNVAAKRNRYNGASSRASQGCQSSREGVRHPNVKRSFHWPLTGPVQRGAMVVIFAVVLSAVISQFGQLRHRVALSSPSQSAGQMRNQTASSPSQPEPAPMASPAIAQNTPANFSRRHLADAEVMRGDVPSGQHQDLQIEPSEQPAKPLSPRCRQTFTVPSETGGQVSVSVVRC